MHASHPLARCLPWLLTTFFLLYTCSRPAAADLAETEQLYLTGQYAKAAQAARQGWETDRRPRREDWPILLLRAQLASGDYESALTNLNEALSDHYYSVRLRVVGREVALQNGNRVRATSLINEINNLGSVRMWAYRSNPRDMTALGRAALVLGAEPKLVLENFFDPARATEEPHREPFLATGELALDKHDFQLAAQTFLEALKHFPKDAEMLYFLGRAYFPNERGRALELLHQALSVNKNLIPAMLLLADHLIDGEEYEAAREMLDRALEVNSRHPETWAYISVIEHLHNNTDAEKAARQKALSLWKTNPAVDHIIGRKLSHKYRFAEGSQHQQKALEFDSSYLPATIQLAQDLLRLGREEAGWELAQRVQKEDGYDVVAYNLVTLRDTLADYGTLTNQHFILRMAAKEAAVYGRRALNLLELARQKLVKRYEADLHYPIIVEIFADQRDFGVRTFGMPHNPGFLGVCFGNVITANSPTTQVDLASNWEAVLWHEFCHVVTLQLTRNKMPRWLSEGISVYEELRQDPAWGQSMDVQYRDLILNGEMAKIQDMSSAFLTASDDLDMQFAYFQSALVVEFLVETYGHDALVRILRDLGAGSLVNPTLERHTAPLEDLEDAFDRFARAKAEALAPDLDFSKPDEELLDGWIPDWLSKKPNNYHALRASAQQLLKDEDWKAAKEKLQELIRLFPSDIKGESPYLLLARVHRQLGETDREEWVLSQLAARNGDALPVYERLMELALTRQDHVAVLKNAERYLAVQPMLPLPYEYQAAAAKALNQPELALQGYRALLQLDPFNPAEVHFQIASLLHGLEEPAAARQHLLQCLEDSPRYREALALLVTLSSRQSNETEQPRSTTPSPQ